MSRRTNITQAQAQSTGYQSFVWSVIEAATMPNYRICVTPPDSGQHGDIALDSSVNVVCNNRLVYSPTESGIESDDTGDNLSLLRRAWYGGQAGFATGLVVTGPETVKIKLQKSKTVNLRQLLTSRGTYGDILKNMPQFSTLLACVCAMEFSINDQVRETHGFLAGVSASGATGAGFLSIADHLIYRGEQGQQTAQAMKSIVKTNGFRGLPAGFVPYFFRESAFMMGITLGPKLADGVSAIVPSVPEETAKDIGRWTLLMASTAATQPFDMVAREIQKQLYQTGERITMRAAVSRLATRPFKEGLFRGGLPRLALAPVGGALAGGLYDRLKKLYDMREGRADIELGDNSPPAP